MTPANALPILPLILLASSLCAAAQTPPRVEVRDSQLVVDGRGQPQLFGAEVQYFRLRGGYGPNLPRAKVIALWNKALDRVVEAKMNAVSFYIPWDFHEYAEGKFDFTGTADADEDGKPDYPSRDLLTFFKLIADHGITRVLVRPGPYINAEWGFLGFGAIPSWFHDRYPESHMRTPSGLRSRLYDYRNPDLIRETQLWFQALWDQVLKNYVGPGKPVIFVQLDNETNYQWQSIYNHDYSEPTISRYQQFLENSYGSLDNLNRAHDRVWERWRQVQPPTEPGRDLPEDRDWYRFADSTIFDFLSDVRRLWEGIGIHEPDVLFTLAESYNAADHGLLPNFVLRNSPGHTGLMTVNLYPKTVEEPEKPLLNLPFKADLDVKSASAANSAYFGSRQQWAMGPEIQGGWWRGIEVSDQARQQTYLTVLGHGLKAFFIYYFNEGQNWDVDWARKQIQPLFDQLAWERHIPVATSSPVPTLPDDFWNELQARSDRQIVAGLDVRHQLAGPPLQDSELFFDSPLDGNANSRAHYDQLKRLGERVVAPYQDFLARSLEVQDGVALVKDSRSHEASQDPNLPSLTASSEWSGGLLGFLMNAGLNPGILHGDLSSEVDFETPRVLVHLDTGWNAARTITLLEQGHARGQVVINFLADGVSRALGFDLKATLLLARSADPATPATPLTFYLDGTGKLVSAGTPGSRSLTVMSSNPVYSYDLGGFSDRCSGILYSGAHVVGYRCEDGSRTIFQIGALLFEAYNSSGYSRMPTASELRTFVSALTREAGVVPALTVSDNAVRTVVFARQDPKRETLWVTVKTGSSESQSFSIHPSSDLLQTALVSPKGVRFEVKNLLANETVTVTAAEIARNGFTVTLPADGSAVFAIRSLPKP